MAIALFQFPLYTHGPRSTEVPLLCARAYVFHKISCSNSFPCVAFSEAVVSSGRVEKSPHEQEIKFFAKVRVEHRPVSLC